MLPAILAVCRLETAVALDISCLSAWDGCGLSICCLSVSDDFCLRYKLFVCLRWLLLWTLAVCLFETVVALLFVSLKRPLSGTLAVCVLETAVAWDISCLSTLDRCFL